MFKSLCCLPLFLISIITYGQDNFIGKWELNNIDADSDSLKITLQIGIPERKILYPATITINTNRFTGSYEFLLLKKNIRQLFISKKKYPIYENPFSLISTLPFYLNGTLDFTIDLKGNFILTNHPIVFSGNETDQAEKKPATILPIEPLANSLKLLFEKTEPQFIKLNNEILDSRVSQSITNPKLSVGYFGLIDTIFAKTKDISFSFPKNSDNDIISIKLNDILIVDQVDSKKKRDDEEITLDTGVNIIGFFSDDFGKKAFSSASIKLELENYNKIISFKDTENIGACFIAAKVFLPSNGPGYRDQNPEDDKNTSDNNMNSLYARFKKLKKNTDSSIQRNTKIIGDLITQNPQLTFAIWDDAVEDGDTISLSINNQWITEDFPVKKKPQFITVSLQPGPNLITFIPKNLGSIPPNTSVLEIIDGKKRKSFYIETDMNLNNQVNIYYDIR